MDYETKIHLVEFITNPAWWSVIATFVAAIVAACITHKLGKHQNELQEQQLKLQKRQNELHEQQIKLQERQNKQQEYEVYRSLYVIIKDINHQANVLPNRIYEYFSISSYNDTFPNGFWNYMYKEVNTLSKELSDKLADFELKFVNNEVDGDVYYQLVCDMRMLLQFAERMEEYKYMICIEAHSNDPAIKAINGDYSALLDAFAERTVYEPYKDAVRDRFASFITARQHILDKNILDKIKERCKID